MKLKRFIKDLVSDVLFSCNRGKWERLNKGDFRILLYHSVEKRDTSVDTMGLAISPELFYAQMKYLKEKGANILSLPDLIAGIINGLPIPDKAVAITFDDGYKSVFTGALPILKEFGFTAAVFINIYFVENKIANSLYYHDWSALSWKEVKQLYGAGLSIGSHALTHGKLAKLSDQEINYEVKQSKILIEDNTGIKINTFSYPHGSFNRRIKNIVRDSGFICSCSSIEGINNTKADFYALKRTEISAFDNSLARFEKKVSGSYDWLGYI